MEVVESMKAPDAVEDSDCVEMLRFDRKESKVARESDRMSAVVVAVAIVDGDKEAGERGFISSGDFS